MADKKRELIDTGNDKRYVRRDDDGSFGSDQVDVGRSSAADQRHAAQSQSKAGEGDRGDRAHKAK
jgi:hypothetical protein